ncbi:hypothetical protein CROQUDRAFT_95121 [Cronartium quercuum f. sp. fusiforme G11]|uniref:Uncharacterized protein n=1 Tax=Cronartium quercuum f. sp. fusiforme G11 TaxID=708437 RepID=A0A9P6NF23_9BASI|nr:hypothetical protein CROQUDRAFT_95121 [Cronartium quercuum f. sp. fusiforme G11]
MPTFSTSESSFLHSISISIKAHLDPAHRSMALQASEASVISFLYIRFFNGVNMIEDIKALPDFRMPTLAKVIEKVDELVLAHGPILTPDEALFVVQVD